VQQINWECICTAFVHCVAATEWCDNVTTKCRKSLVSSSNQTTCKKGQFDIWIGDNQIFYNFVTGDTMDRSYFWLLASNKDLISMIGKTSHRHGMQNTLTEWMHGTYAIQCNGVSENKCTKKTTPLISQPQFE